MHRRVQQHIDFVRLVARDRDVSMYMLVQNHFHIVNTEMLSSVSSPLTSSKDMLLLSVMFIRSRSSYWASSRQAFSMSVKRWMVREMFELKHSARISIVPRYSASHYRHALQRVIQIHESLLAMLLFRMLPCAVPSCGWVSENACPTTSESRFEHRMHVLQRQTADCPLAAVLSNVLRFTPSLQSQLSG